jgi:hypothetical protein
VKDDLAERLLSRVMDWDTTEIKQYIPDLQMLAAIKYDEYGNYGPGAKFLESLAAWLQQLSEDHRQVALDFVLNELVFVSETQMSHLINSGPYGGHCAGAAVPGRCKHRHCSTPHPQD